jgi:hypothetical protein
MRICSVEQCGRDTGQRKDYCQMHYFRIECGNEAEHWSYDHLDPNEQYGPDGAYTTDLTHYQPRCVSCHKTYDLAFV